MAFLDPNNTISLVPDSPAVKRQKTASGYKSTSNSADNTGAYNSENDSGDELFAGYVPDTPGRYETQPTQIIDRSAPHVPSSPTPSSVVQVPASSPFKGRDSELPKRDLNPPPKPAEPPKRNLAMSMAPAGTAYKPPHGIISRPAQTIIAIPDDDDDGPQFQGGSSDDDEVTQRANIKPTAFISRSPQNSFGASSSHDVPKMTTGNAKFQSAVANAAYKPLEKGRVYSGSIYDSRNRDSATNSSSISASKPKTSTDSMSSGYGSVRKPQIQTRPERAKPIEDISLDDMTDESLRAKVTQVRNILPSVTVLTAKNAIIACKGSFEDAINMLCEQEQPIVIDDNDEIESPQPTKKAEPQMKRMLTGPTTSLRDKYSSTQAMPPRQPATMATPPAKPKRKLMQGRRNPSSPAMPAVSSPLRAPSQPSPAPSLPGSYDSDSGVASATEEDPELEGRVLKHLNTCSIDDLIELTNTTKEFAEAMIAARPFRNIDIARAVENPKLLKSGKKSTKAAIGDKLVSTAIDMFSGYEAIDSLVAQCEQLGKPLRAEMDSWGFDTNGASKDGELEMISFEEDIESQRDSGIGSPSSGTASNNGDDDIKIVSSTRKRNNFQYLKKPEMMAEDCVLKDYQVVGLNWLALMYRHKVSCILADEMGLGKTCQVIAFLSHLVETGNHGPHLVVCPGSTLENWLRELRRFSPNLTIEPYHGMFCEI
jgi:SWI/SNF-related matrix-associated actin-dependent regulator of chromatin subfamily A containing DEAD/H box 1